MLTSVLGEARRGSGGGLAPGERCSVVSDEANPDLEAAAAAIDEVAPASQERTLRRSSILLAARMVGLQIWRRSIDNEGWIAGSRLQSRVAGGSSRRWVQGFEVMVVADEGG